jgi:hypothetical protein
VNALLYQQFLAAQIAVNRARILARAGRKDEARDWLRHLENSRTVSLLSEFYTGALPIQIETLAGDLKALREETHPESHADHSSEFAEIKTRLDSIAFGISEILNRSPK